MVVISNFVSEPRRIHLRMLTQGCSSSFDHHIIEGNFYRRKFIHALSRFYGLVHVDFHGQVEVRCTKFAFGKTLRNNLPHLGDFFLLKRFLTYRYRGDAGRSWSRWGFHASWIEGFYVSFDDPSTFACSL